MSFWNRLVAMLVASAVFRAPYDLDVYEAYKEFKELK